MYPPVKQFEAIKREVAERKMLYAARAAAGKRSVERRAERFGTAAPLKPCMD